MKIAQKIKKGLINVSKDPKVGSAAPAFYNIWEKEGDMLDHPMHIAAPKLSLPGKISPAPFSSS